MLSSYYLDCGVPNWNRWWPFLLIALVLASACSDRRKQSNQDKFESREAFLNEFLSFEIPFRISVKAEYKIDGKAVKVDLVRRSDERECIELVRLLRSLNIGSLIAELDSQSNMGPGSASTVVIAVENKKSHCILWIFGEDTIVKNEGQKSFVFRLHPSTDKPLLFNILSICNPREGERVETKTKDDNDPFGGSK